MAAGEKKVHVMGGGSVIQQVLKAGLADELLLHVASVLVSDGTPLFEHLGGPIQLERMGGVQARFADHLRFPVGTCRPPLNGGSGGPQPTTRQAAAFRQGANA